MGMKHLTGRLLATLLILAVCPLAAIQAQSEVRVAVVAFDVFLVDKEMGSVVAQLITSKLSTLSGIEIAERSRLDEVLSEMELSQAGVVAPEQAVETGKLLGANAIVMGSVGKIGVKFVINIRLVDTESGKVMKAFSVSGDRQEDYLELSESLAALLAGVIRGTESAGSGSATSIQESAAVAGYWNTEWYDGIGRHGGSMFLQEKGGNLTGWTIEDIGPARIEGSVRGNALKGEYSADYGHGTFEFTLTADGERLVGSYTTSDALHSTWNAWRRPEPYARLSQGDRVLVDWSGDIWSYPAIAAKKDGNRWFVRYDDGDSEWIDANRVYAFRILPDEVVQVAGEDKKGYRSASFLALSDGFIQVEYPDGERKREPVSRLRLLRVRSWGY